MQAILFASLCGSIQVKAGVRRGGFQPKDLPSIDVSAGLPSHRYYKLIEYFSKIPRPSLQHDEEAAYLVNYACEVLFGKGLVEEIEEDIAHTDEIADRYMEWSEDIPYEVRPFNMVPAFCLLKDYRKIVFNYFRNDITTFTSPNSYMKVTANFLKPSLIYNLPQGVEALEPIPLPIGKAVGLIDRHSIFAQREGGIETRTVYSYWSPQAGDLGHDIGIEEAEIDVSDNAFKDATLSSLQTMYGTFAPLYRWLLFGNRYLTMSEFENDRIVDALKLQKDRFVIDEFYSKSQDISTSTAFFRFFGEIQMRCDVCYSDVGEQESFVLSARTVRQNSALSEHFSQESPDTYRYLFERDWSDWLFCTDCMRRWSFPIPGTVMTRTE